MIEAPRKSASLKEGICRSYGAYDLLGLIFYKHAGPTGLGRRREQLGAKLFKSGLPIADCGIINSTHHWTGLIGQN